MIRQKETDLVNFLKEFDNVNDDAIVCLIISNEVYEIFSKCRKRNVDIWALNEKGIRFFIEGADINSHGAMLSAEKCKVLEDDTSIDYCIYDHNFKNRLICISVLKE